MKTRKTKATGRTECPHASTFKTRTKRDRICGPTNSQIREFVFLIVCTTVATDSHNQPRNDGENDALSTYIIRIQSGPDLPGSLSQYRLTSSGLLDRYINTHFSSVPQKSWQQQGDMAAACREAENLQALRSRFVRVCRSFPSHHWMDCSYPHVSLNHTQCEPQKQNMILCPLS